MKSRPNTISYHIMLFPSIILFCIFSIYPLSGSVLAFKQFKAAKGIWGSPWVGFENFEILFSAPNFYQILYNTVYIAVMKIILNLVIPLVFALMLNEIRKIWFKKTVQTIVYLPYFLSWVILAGIFKDIFSTTGLINKLYEIVTGAEPIMFFASTKAFPVIAILTDTWKNYGFNVIIYLAALSGIDMGLYEASRIDGASRWKQLLHITLPSLMPTVILLATLSLQSVLNAGFDQIFNLYNPLVYETGDILDTYIYRMGLIDNQFEVATALGIMKSAISFGFIYIAHALAEKYAKYRIF